MIDLKLTANEDGHAISPSLTQFLRYMLLEIRHLLKSFEKQSLDDCGRSMAPDRNI